MLRNQIAEMQSKIFRDRGECGLPSPVAGSRRSSDREAHLIIDRTGAPPPRFHSVSLRTTLVSTRSLAEDPVGNIARDTPSRSHSPHSGAAHDSTPSRRPVDVTMRRMAGKMHPPVHELSCLGSSVGRALCLEYRVSWVRVPPEAAHFF